MKIKKIFFIFAGMLIFSIPGWAQTFEGNVVVVDSTAQVINI